MTLHVPSLGKAGQRGHYVNCSRKDVDRALFVTSECSLFLWLRKGAPSWKARGFLVISDRWLCDECACVCVCVHAQMDNRSLCLDTTMCYDHREWEGHLQGLSPGCLGDVLPERTDCPGEFLEKDPVPAPQTREVPAAGQSRRHWQGPMPTPQMCWDPKCVSSISVPGAQAEFKLSVTKYGCF